MKTNPNETANAVVVRTYVHSGEYKDEVVGGLTKREYFAALAMQGVEASNIYDDTHEVLSFKEIAKRSVALADALIAELNKENQNEKV